MMIVKILIDSKFSKKEKESVSIRSLKRIRREGDKFSKKFKYQTGNTNIKYFESKFSHEWKMWKFFRDEEEKNFVNI
jgi:hypothetical protein